MNITLKNSLDSMTKDLSYKESYIKGIENDLVATTIKLGDLQAKYHSSLTKETHKQKENIQNKYNDDDNKDYNSNSNYLELVSIINKLAYNLLN